MTTILARHEENHLISHSVGRDVATTARGLLLLMDDIIASSLSQAM
jgi:hypothetical protein